MAYDTRQIISVVTDALVQQAAREMGEDANVHPEEIHVDVGGFEPCS